MNDNINADGTFYPVKDITDKSQCYNISTQLYSPDHKQTHCQPILSALLPNGETQTYRKMWDVIGQLCLEYSGEVLNPRKIHMDNEKSFMNATKEKYPEAIIQTCYYHISENIRRKCKYLKKIKIFSKISKKNFQKKLPKKIFQKSSKFNNYILFSSSIWHQRT